MKVKVMTSNDSQAYNVFYNCVKTPLLVYRCMGLLPIDGLLNSDSKKSHFEFKSLYNIFFGTTILIHVIGFVLIYYSLFHTDKKIVRDCCVMMCMSMCYFCKHWRSSLREIESIEMSLPSLRRQNVLIHRIKWFVGLMLIIFLSELIAFNLCTVMFVKYCFLLEDDSGWYLRSYFLALNSWFYHHIPFNYASGFITQVVKLQSVFICQFSDTLIVVIIAYLSSRMKHFYGNLVRKIKKRAGTQVPWLELQAQFTGLTKLVSSVDNLISPFILTCFLSHLMFICKQVYDILQKNRTANMFQKTECVSNHSNDPITVIYFSISLVALLLRSSMVSLMAARLHTLSREPLKALHVVPTSVYNYEMQRFMDQVYYSKIGLSGLRIFYVTRGTVLSMVSTILTYELVFLQIKE